MLSLGGLLTERKDEELFVIDKTRQEDVVKLTRGQQLAQAKRQHLQESVLLSSILDCRRVCYFGCCVKL